MALFGLNINIKVGLQFLRKPRLTKEDVLVWGTILALALAGFLILRDGYLFYSAVLKERASPGRDFAGGERDILTPEEIDEASGILDERARKFEEIFGAPL